MALVEDPLYRSENLEANNIYFIAGKEKFPKATAEIINYIRQNCASIGLPPNDPARAAQLTFLGIGAGEVEVQDFFYGDVLPRLDRGNSLQCAIKAHMASNVVPRTESVLKVSIPVPDILYGYRRETAFHQQREQLRSMRCDVVANNEDLICPFLAIELKADGPTGVGSLWVATNQCLGASATCVNMIERLNRRLRYAESNNVGMTHGAAFSIAMNATEARLYVTWKHDKDRYHMAQVDSFLLQRRSHLISFRSHVQNILEWGRGKRLDEIRRSLGIYAEERKKGPS